MEYRSDTFAPLPNENNTNLAGSVGFRFRRVDAKETVSVHYDKCNQLIFQLEGRAVLNSSESLDIIICGGEFCFMPLSAELSCTAMTNSSFLIFSFDNFQALCERAYFRELRSISPQAEHRFNVFTMPEPLDTFVRNIAAYANDTLMESQYPALKLEELLYLLRMLYTKEEMASLFYTLAGNSFEFRKFIFSNFLRSKNVEELVALSGLGKKTFDRQFNDEFGVPPSKWVVARKAKHIYYALSETEDQVQVIMRRYGFTVAPHFTSFCKEQFHATPLELRRRLRISKNDSWVYYK